MQETTLCCATLLMAATRHIADVQGSLVEGPQRPRTCRPRRLLEWLFHFGSSRSAGVGSKGRCGP